MIASEIIVCTQMYKPCLYIRPDALNLILSGIFCLILSGYASAQRRDVKWYSGEVTIREGPTITSEFCIRTLVNEEILIIKQGDRQLAFPPQKVLSVSAGDASTKWKTDYFEYPNHRACLFFEELAVKGDLILYKKDLHTTKTGFLSLSFLRDLLVWASHPMDNEEALLLKNRRNNRMAVITLDEPSTRRGIYHFDKKILSDFLETDVETLTSVLKEENIKLRSVEAVTSLLEAYQERKWDIAPEADRLKGS